MLQLLYIFDKLLWYWQVWGDEKGYRFNVFLFSRKRIVWLYTKWEKKIVALVTQQRLKSQSLQTLAAVCFPEGVLLNTEDIRKDSRGCSRENFHELKCCVCVARHSAVTTLRATGLKSVAGVEASEHAKTVETNPWQNVGKCWTKQKM